MEPIVLTSPVTVGTGLTNIFTMNNVTPGSYYIEAEMYSVNVGTGTVTLTATFNGGGVGTPSFNVMRILAAGGVTVTNHNAFGTTGGNTWVYAKMNGLIVVTTAGNLLIGATRTGGTSNIIQPGSYFQLGAS